MSDTQIISFDQFNVICDSAAAIMIKWEDRPRMTIHLDDLYITERGKGYMLYGDTIENVECVSKVDFILDHPDDDNILHAVYMEEDGMSIGLQNIVTGKKIATITPTFTKKLKND